MIKNLNLPNKLTLARIIATPIFMLTLVWDFKFHYAVALIIFCAASLTDLYDGKYARSHNMVTDFGKFLDPLADKMLTTSAFLGFLHANIGFGIVWIVFIVLFREFLMSSLRLVAVSSGGKVIAANVFGKFKTVSQMVAIIYTLFSLVLTDIFKSDILATVLSSLSDVLLWVSAILTIVSGVIYLKDNMKFIDPSK